jgi:hypothetical protein
MNLEKLYALLGECSQQLRKGDIVHGTPELVDAIERGDQHLPGGVVSIDMMPHVEAAPDLAKIDCHFLWVGVDKAKAERWRADLVALLADYPEPERLAVGPSYIEVGAVIGDQGAAFQLFAIGEVLGLWTVITPERLGITGPTADDMAGRGYVMMSGYTT